MEKKLIKVDADVHEAIRIEAVKQSLKPNCVVTMGDVIRQFADKLKKAKK